MSERPLNDRQAFALRWLNENTRPVNIGVRGENSQYAFALADALIKAGIMERSRHSNGYRADSRAAANSLVALKRRGYAANDGGGVFEQARWWITTAGQEACQ